LNLDFSDLPQATNDEQLTPPNDQGEKSTTENLEPLSTTPEPVIEEVQPVISEPPQVEEVTPVVEEEVIPTVEKEIQPVIEETQSIEETPIIDVSKVEEHPVSTIENSESEIHNPVAEGPKDPDTDAAPAPDKNPGTSESSSEDRLKTEDKIVEEKAEEEPEEIKSEEPNQPTNKLDNLPIMDEETKEEIIQKEEKAIEENKFDINKTNLESDQKIIDELVQTENFASQQPMTPNGRGEKSTTENYEPLSATTQPIIQQPKPIEEVPPVSVIANPTPS
jgi:hypothetical protein